MSKKIARPTMPPTERVLPRYVQITVLKTFKEAEWKDNFVGFMIWERTDNTQSVVRKD